MFVMYTFYVLGLLNAAEHLLENREHLSAIRALAAARLDTCGKHLHRLQEPKVYPIG